jgi:hypothetical protein
METTKKLLSSIKEIFVAKGYEAPGESDNSLILEDADFIPSPAAKFTGDSLIIEEPVKKISATSAEINPKDGPLPDQPIQKKVPKMINGQLQWVLPEPPLLVNNNNNNVSGRTSTQHGPVINVIQNEALQLNKAKNTASGNRGPDSTVPTNVQSSTCQICSFSGHKAEECRTPQCYKCAKFGHVSKSCKENVCYRCGEPGHRSINCKTAPGSKCKFCGSCDHYTGQCKNKKQRHGARNGTRAAQSDHLIASSLKDHVQEMQGQRDARNDQDIQGGSNQALYMYKYANPEADPGQIPQLKDKIKSLEEAIKGRQDLQSKQVFAAFLQQLTSRDEPLYVKYSTHEYDRWHQSASYRVFHTPISTIVTLSLIFFALYVINIPLSLIYHEWSLVSLFWALVMSIFLGSALFLLIVLIDVFRCVVLMKPSWFGQGDYTEVWISLALRAPPIHDVRNDRKQTDELVHENPLCVFFKTRRTLNRWVQFEVNHGVCSLELVAQCGGADFMPIDADPVQAYHAICTTVSRECKTNIDRYGNIFGYNVEFGTAYVCYALWMQAQNEFSVLDFSQGQAIKV